MECLRDGFNAGVVLGGRYQTIAPLNHGSFGMVFTARDMHTSDTVAIKCLTKTAAANSAGFDFAIDDKSEERLLHRRLGSHENIVNLIDSFETDAHVFLVLEFCARGDLYEAIRNGQGPLETEHVRRFMLELVDAVSYMHSKGVYHRDIKPENIFLTESGSMKLGDFGLATTERWTHEMTVGSDRYMSPEQYDSAGAGYSPAQADVWAIGICLLNVLFSRNPFTTPTEADPLFLDFSRDKQSLFDVFPSMSQDTYEVIVECMNLDPSKRSLIGARQALARVVSFTTLDEALDDFCSAEPRTFATANREPLRTPSIQSPLVDTGAFPWAKALQVAAPRPIRKLSAIPDMDSYTEDLFSHSGATTTDWCSALDQTPSLASVLDSSFGASMQSLNISIPQKKKSSHLAGSLPITMTKPRYNAAMSTVFGRRDTMSKSWSDMWDDDAEEEEEMTRKLQVLKELNSRTWSHDSKADNDNTPRQGLSPTTKAQAIDIKTADVPSIESTISNDIDGDLVADGFFFHEPIPEQKPQSSTAHRNRGSPSPKRNAHDKWTALGERRRAYTSTSSSARTTGVTIKASLPTTNGLEFNSFGQAAAVHHSSAAPHSNYSFLTNQQPVNTYSTPNKWSTGKDRTKDSPWTRGRERDWNLNWRRERRHDFGDIEWVGGWQEAHS